MTDNRIRAVFNTNVVIAALLSPSATSPNAELIERWREGQFDLLYCDEIMIEYAEKMEARKVDPWKAREFLADLVAAAGYVEVEPDKIDQIILNDPDDDVILACARLGNATHIVTYDPDFDFLGGEYEGIKIVDGLHFLYIVRGDRK